MKKLFKTIFFLIISLIFIKNVNALQTSFTDDFKGFAIDFDDSRNRIVIYANDDNVIPWANATNTFFKIASQLPDDEGNYADGKMLYCSDGNKLSPSLGSGSSPFNENCKIINDTNSNYKSIAYIYENGYGTYKTNYSATDYLTGDMEADYFITQAAIWHFTIQNNFIKNFDLENGTYNGQSNEVTKKLTKLINDATAAASGASLKLEASNKNMSLTSDKKYYISDSIKLTGKYLNSKITTTLSGINSAFVTTDKNATSGSTTFNNNSVVYVKVPIDKVTGEANITLKVNATTSIEQSEAIECGPPYAEISSIQPIIIFYPKNSTLNDSVVLNVKSSLHQVKISKQDINNSEEIAGATLTLKDSSGSTISTWVSDKTTKTFSLLPGTYTLEETIAPEGYIKSTSKIEFTINDSGKVLVGGKEVSELIITNKPMVVKISKRDITNNEEIEGAKLKITDKNGNIAKDIHGNNLEWTSGTKPKTFNLKMGTYVLTETIAPDGYKLSSNSIEFTINAQGKVLVDGKEVSEVVFTNEPIMVTISKKSITNNSELIGAKLKITDKDGNISKDISGNELEWISEATPKSFNLKAGDYILTETIAPDGYILSSKSIEFTITEEGKVLVEGKEVSEVVFTNEPIIVRISKRSITSTNELKGAKLKITDKNGNIAKDLLGNKLQWTSGDSPKSFNLKAGNYILTETIAPDGYELSEKTIEFTVTNEGKVLIDGKEVIDNLIIFENTPEPEQVQTGSPIIYVAGILSLAVIGIMIFYIRKRKEK